MWGNHQSENKTQQKTPSWSRTRIIRSRLKERGWRKAEIWAKKRKAPPHVPQTRRWRRRQNQVKVRIISSQSPINRDSLYIWLNVQHVGKTHKCVYYPSKIISFDKKIISSGSPDTITCGQCTETFLLDNFLAFIQHKGTHILRMQVSTKFSFLFQFFNDMVWIIVVCIPFSQRPTTRMLRVVCSCHLDIVIKFLPLSKSLPSNHNHNQCSGAEQGSGQEESTFGDCKPVSWHIRWPFVCPYNGGHYDDICPTSWPVIANHWVYEVTLSLSPMMVIMMMIEVTLEYGC